MITDNKITLNLASDWIIKDFAAKTSKLVRKETKEG